MNDFSKISQFIASVWTSLFSIIKILVLSKFNLNFEKQKGLSEIVILGNGPSLNQSLKEDLAIILKRKKLCVNLFALSPQFQEIKPDYYVLAAPEFWMKDTTEFIISNRNALKNVFTKVDWPMTILMPHQSSKNPHWKELANSNRNLNVTYFNNTPIEGFPTLCNLLFEMNLGMPRPHNVLVPSIFLALNLGFKKIYLFGADHSWHEEIKIDESNKAVINHQHFYDSAQQLKPMYKLDGQEYHLHDIFRKLHLAFKGYFVLRDYAKYLNAAILNASKKSYIDAFDKIKIPSEE